MYRFAHRCFNDAILSVEIHWKGKLVTSFFPRPSVGNNLEEEAKQALRQNIDISTEEDQQKDFVKRARLLHAEMVHFTDLQSVNVPFTDTSIYDMIISRLDMCRQLGFGLAVIINIITLTCVRVPEGGTSSVPFYTDDYASTVTLVLAGCLTFLSLLLLVLQLVKRAPLSYQDHLHDFKKTMRKLHGDSAGGAGGLMGGAGAALGDAKAAAEDFIQGVRGLLFKVVLPVGLKQFALLIAAALFDLKYGAKQGYYICLVSVVPMALTTLRSHWDQPSSVPAFLFLCGYDILINPDTLYRIVHLTFGILGLLIGPYFFCFHLFEVIGLSPTLRNVMRAVYVPIRQLGMTAVLAIFVIFTYT
jgi:hypothetical protein